MIRRPDLLAEAERIHIRGKKPSFKENLAIAESLHRTAVKLGAFPLADPLAGIDVDIRMARNLNRVRTTPRRYRFRPR